MRSTNNCSGYSWYTNAMKRLIFAAVVVVASLVFAGCRLLELKTVAGLQVVTSDKPTSVFINGQYLNKTPFIDRNLKPGVYTLLLQPDDDTLVPHETTITLRKGFVSMVTWKPESLPELSGGVVLEMEPLESSEQAEVAFTTIPDAAIIHVDGKKEFSPHTFTELSVGQHDFEISLPSYETQKHTLDVQAGYKLLVSVKLAKSQAIESTDTSEVGEGHELTAPTSTVSAENVLGAETASSSGQVTILPTNFFQNEAEVLRVRKAPNAQAAELGFAPVGERYILQSEQGSWYQIVFNGQPGWISAQFARKE